MNDIWSIIGLSSLVASVVSVILGFIREVLAEKYRFKRESEAGYLQKQIEIHSRIHLLLKYFARSTPSELFGETVENIKEINDIIKAQSSLLDQKTLDRWFDIWELYDEYKKDRKGRKKEEILRKTRDYITELLSFIKDRMNNTLTPKYRKIVGETVPDLD